MEGYMPSLVLLLVPAGHTVTDPSYYDGCSRPAAWHSLQRPGIGGQAAYPSGPLAGRPSYVTRREHVTKTGFCELDHSCCVSMAHKCCGRPAVDDSMPPGPSPVRCSPAALYRMMAQNLVTELNRIPCRRLWFLKPSIRVSLSRPGPCWTRQ
jgi:hypothetical protein